MTINREIVWSWLATAPPAVVLSICLTATGALAAWTWLIAGEVRDQHATVAVAAEQARAASESQHRSEAKIDRLIEVVSDLRADIARLRRDRDREKTR